MTTATMAAVSAKPGKYLCFGVDLLEYGLEIAKVQQIVGIADLVTMPRLPAPVRGVVEVGDRVVPVVDLRGKLNLEIEVRPDSQCIVVVRVDRDGEQVDLGVTADEVSEVLSFTPEQITEAPDTCGVDAVSGVGKLGSKMVVLLDADRLLDGVPAFVDVEGKDVLR